MAEVVSRIYSSFRGVDFRGEEINLVRSPDSLNMWKDYKETESIRTRPALEAFEVNAAVDVERINGIFFFDGKALIHHGTRLTLKNGATATELCSDLADRKSSAFVYDNKWYFKDGTNYLVYDGSTLSDVVGYVPTTTIGRKPMGGGTKHEDVNMLSDYRINTFLADGESTDFFLDVSHIDEDYYPEVKVDGEVVSSDKLRISYGKGQITFATAPEVPLTDGQDNVSIKFKKTVSGHKDIIKNCTLLQMFDNRVFFSGNADYPSYIWHCSLDDPTYCSDLDYYEEGMDGGEIKGLVAGNNALWVFREPSDSNTTVFYHTPAIDEEYGKIYPSVHSSISTGCIGSAVNFNDDIVFFSDRGMEGISGDVTTEQMLSHRSSLVDRKLIAEAGYSDMVLAEWNGYLLVCIGNKVYLADSRGVFTNGNHYEYEWFYWRLERNVFCTAVYEDVLYLGTDKGVYTLTDNEGDVSSYWVTPIDKFNNPNKLKTTNKRGCVAEATGEITLSVKLEDTDFETIGTYGNVTDAFVARIKEKKFKDIQFKFSTQTRFSIEAFTVECFIGGYVKRVTQVTENKGSSGGKSAYEIALDNGFVGTVEEWLESLGGEDGHTPVRGVDYLTDADVESLIDSVSNAIGIRWWNQQLEVKASDGNWIPAGGVGIIVKVAAPAGTAITATNGEITLRGVSDGSVTVFSLPVYDVWTFTGIVDGEETNSVVLDCSIAKLYILSLDAFEAYVEVTAHNGATVTLTGGGSSQTALCQSASGEVTARARFTVRSQGEYRAVAEYAGVSSSADVIPVNADGELYTTALQFLTVAVTAPEGSQITLSRGSYSYSKTAEGGTALFYLPETGVWNVTAALDGNEAQRSIECGIMGAYELEIQYPESSGGEGTGGEEPTDPCADGHIEVVTTYAQSPTCTSSGCTEGTKCSRCGITIKASEHLSATGHSPVTDRAVAATCTSTGLTEGSHCTRCGATIVAQKNVAKLEHIRSGWKVLKANPLAGHFKQCTVCNTKLDEGAHVWDDWGNDTTGLNHKRTCQICGYVQTEPHETSTTRYYEIESDTMHERHWTCSVCGTRGHTSESHTWDNEDVGHRTCTLCGAQG